MLAVTANWLITDGTLAPARSAEAAGWLHTIRRAVVRAGFRRDGRYAPVESVTLVLAGDTFDWLLSDTWSGRDRPWHGGPRSRAARAKVAAASLRAARPLLARLRRWGRHGIPVPAVDLRGRPSARSVQHAQLQVVMLAGDRDAWAAEAFLSQNESARRFGAWVGESWADGEVAIRHGHDRDPVTHALAGSMAPGIGRSPALAESLAVELVVPFGLALKADHALWHLARPRMGALAAADVTGLPQAVMRLVGVWGAASPPGRRVLMAWRRSVTQWRTAAGREPPVTEAEHDVVGPLSDWLEASIEHPALAVPEAVARLVMAPSGADDHGAILGHAPNHVSGSKTVPWLMLVKPSRSLEPLGQSTPGSPVVTIGLTEGQSLVDAA